MSVLTVLTAWWSVGAAVQVWRRVRPPSHLVVAIAVGLFFYARAMSKRGVLV
jgi:hypothetical protein